MGVLGSVSFLGIEKGVWKEEAQSNLQDQGKDMDKSIHLKVYITKRG